MFDANARKAIASIARGLGVEPAALLAVAEIESAGKPFAMVRGRPMPLIRWEGHYFYRLLPSNLREAGVKARLAHPSVGAIPNPTSQEARYAMLERGKAINDEAAISSCSWGLGQVMGSHWRRLGFSSPDHFVKVACSGIAGQTDLMARFIRMNGLTASLKKRDWKAFARAYNGPAYRANRYDEKMARAYIRYLKGKPPPAGIAAPIITDYVPPMKEFTPAREEQFVLKPGSSGPAVKELQQALRRAGIFLYIDGHYGPTTTKAVSEFQRKSGLTASGRVNEETRAKLAGTATPGGGSAWWSPKAAPQAATAGPAWAAPRGTPAAGAATPQRPPRQGKTAWWDV